MIRLARPEGMQAVTDLDFEAFNPYVTTETLETFQMRVQTNPQEFIVLELKEFK